MAKVWFDFSATTNGDGTSPRSPKNTLAGFTPNASDELYFRRGGVYAGSIPLVAGTTAKRTKYNAWYNTDGTDDLTKPRPQFTLTAPLSTYGAAPNNIEVSSLDLRGNALTVAADAAIIYLGNNCYFTNNNVDSNVGCVGASGKSNVNIMYNTLAGVSFAGTANCNVLVAADSVAVDTVNIIGNTVYHKGGGGNASHGMRVEYQADDGKAMTNVLVKNNTITPQTGTAYIQNQQSLGMRFQNLDNPEIGHNTVKGMLSGLFMVGGTIFKQNGRIHHNVMQYNYNFGIHLSTNTNGATIEYNDCSYNGTSTNNAVMYAYGRGIELTSAAGQGSCENHSVRFNVCNYNYNYGGPSDNGSEGVGIGLDDGCSRCGVYGNICMNNEGNGVQVFGGQLSSSWTDPGGNIIAANYFENNSTNSILNRRSGGTYQTAFVGHINLSNAYGTQTIVANNVMKGGKCGIWLNSGCTLSTIMIANNIMIDVPHGIASASTTNLTCYSNLFFNPTVAQVTKYSDTSTDANGVPKYVAYTFSGNNDKNVDPQLDANYRPKAGSPVIGAGYVAGHYLDHENKPFSATSPSIGMFEYIPSSIPVSRL